MPFASLWKQIGVATTLPVLAALPWPVGSQPITLDERRQTLVRMVRQDCGSCHGLRLKGGLGPALLPETLRDKAAESLEATVMYGRPGTAMPPFRGMLSESEVRWIVERLVTGFPEEPKR